jgi:uncharacterized membrane protein YdbT with pleckstrin-like domain
MDQDLSHLVPGTYQTFGKRTYWIFLAQWLGFPVFLLGAAFLISLVRKTGLVPVGLQKHVAITSYVFLAFAFITCLVSVLVARYVYRSRGFSLANDAFKIKQGIFTKQEMAIPYRQIQNVEIERTFTQQILGVSKIVIVTAGSDDAKTEFNESKGILNTVDKELASALQEELIKRSDIQRISRVI